MNECPECGTESLDDDGFCHMCQEWMERLRISRDQVEALL